MIIKLFAKKEVQMALTYLTSREMQIKLQLESIYPQSE